MGQISRFLRNIQYSPSQYGLTYWCQGCRELHQVITSGPGAWEYNNNPDAPTFHPSVKVTGLQIYQDDRGDWTGKWKKDASGNPIPLICHTYITDGMVRFLEDCTHEFAGQTLPLPELPPWHRDDPCP